MDNYLEKNSFSKNVKNIIFGLILSFISTLILIVILSLLLCYTDLNEKNIDSSLIFISTFSILIGAFVSLKIIKEKGFLIGAIIGGVYIIILYVISSFLNNNFGVGWSSIIMIILSIISGMLGGILGVNLKM